MDDAERQIHRRAVLGLLGASAVAVACGGSKAAVHPTSSGSTVGSSGPASGTIVTIGGTAVDVAHRFADDEVSLAKSHYSGVWLGTWVDDKGGTGTADAAIDVDTSARMLTVTTRFTGSLLGGSPPPPATYKIAVDAFSKDADTLNLVSPQLGLVKVDPVAFRLTCSALPGHTEIDSLNVSATVTGATAICAYTLTRSDASKTKGAFAWSRGGSRPPAPQLGGATAQTDFVQGDYAAGLLTTAELTAAFGRPAAPPMANGGRLVYQPGIGTSNARGESIDGALVVQYTIYRGTDSATAKAYYGLNSAVAQPISGLGDAAQLISAVSHLEVLRGREVLELSVLDTTSATSSVQLLAMSKQLATDIVTRMAQS